MNDTAQSQYTDTVQLPYFNMALDELQELFELNNVPVTNEVFPIINIPSSTAVTKLGASILPNNLIEIQKLWERAEGVDPFIPMTRKESLPHYLESVPTNHLRIWAWINEEIWLLPSNADNDIKIDGIKSIFPEDVTDTKTLISVKNVKSFLQYKTAALCAHFIAENKTRSDELNTLAGLALERNLGINVKGKQSIITRRRPFRAAYKMRSNW